MKNFVLSLAFLFIGANVHAATILHIPLFIEGSDKPIPAAEINQKLKAVGAPLIPEYVDLTAQDKAYEMFKDIDAKISASLKFLGKDYDYVERAWDLIPGENNQGPYITCYRGDATQVADIVAGLADVLYSDQLNLWGWKYKNQTTLLTDDQEGTTDKFLADGSALWKNWQGKNDDLLILSAVGDDGDDVNESLIPRCR